ncbi:MAG: ABC transporter permease, partial [Gemmatimonadetes bacterium]|nr:ABC transporter permease [Gemmatimonadota bacterium]
MGDRRRRELDEEIEAHLALRTEALVREGLDPARARAEAERRFGGAGGRRRLRRSARLRDARLGLAGLADGLVRDLRLALRHIRRRPGPAALELATFALGVGLTTATWTLVDRIVLRPLPLPEAHRLVTLQPVDSAGTALYVTSAAMWLDWREAGEGLESSAIYLPGSATVEVDGSASRVPSADVSGAFFQTLGLPLAAGRAPTEEEALAGEPLAVVSEGFVERFLGGRFTPGQQVRVTGRPLAVVGVVRQGSEFPAGTDLWVPREVRRATVGSRNNVNWIAVARLRDGTLAPGVDAVLDAVARGVREADPDAAYAHGVVVLPLRDLIVGEDDARALWFLLAAVAVVLILGSLNLAGIGVARASAARGEAAVHVALGAGPGRLVQREVVRHLVTGLAGGIAGILLAWTAIGLVARVAASAGQDADWQRFQVVEDQVAALAEDLRRHDPLQRPLVVEAVDRHQRYALLADVLVRPAGGGRLLNELVQPRTAEAPLPMLGCSPWTSLDLRWSPAATQQVQSLLPRATHVGWC